LYKTMEVPLVDALVREPLSTFMQLLASWSVTNKFTIVIFVSPRLVSQSHSRTWTVMSLL
jgi:hypothetical protein